MKKWLGKIASWAKALKKAWDNVPEDDKEKLVDGAKKLAKKASKSRND